MKTKYFIHFSLVLILLWISFILIALYTPTTKSGMKTWLKTVNQVIVEISGVEKDDQYNIRVMRVSRRGKDDQLYMIHESKAVFSGKDAYYSGLAIEIPDRNIEQVENIKITIGDKENSINKNEINKHFNIIKNTEGKHRYILLDAELFPNETIVPYMYKVINYRGDKYLFGFSFIISLLISIGVFVIILQKEKVKYLMSPETAIIIVSLIFISSRLLTGIISSTFVLILLDTLLIWLIVVASISIRYAEMRIERTMFSFHEKKGKIFALIIAATIMFVCIYYLFLGRTWLDDGKYFIRGYWYATGNMVPYGSRDGNWYAPFFFMVIGFWQQFFGGIFSHNLVTIRLFSTLLNFFNCFILVLIIKKLTNNYFLVLLSIILYLATPFGFFYYNSATPYSFVTSISLLIWMLYIYPEKYVWWFRSVLFGLGYILLIFTRRNMVLAVPFLVIFQILTLRRGYIKKIAVTFITIILVATLLLSVFPKKLQHVMAGLPFINKVVYDLGLLDRYDVEPSAPIINGTLTNITASTNTISNKKNNTFLASFYKIIWTDYAEHYFPYIISCVFCVVLLFRNRKNPGLFAAVYFVVVSLAHALGAPGTASVRAYIHYIMVFGVIGTVVGLNELEVRFNQKIMLRSAGLICAITLIFFWYPASLKETYSLMESPVVYIGKFAKELQPYLKEKKEVLVIDTDSYDGVKAVHFAGGITEPASLNLEYAYRKPAIMNGLIDFEVLEKRNWWTDQRMEWWIDEKYDIALVLRGDPYGEQYRDLIEKKMHIVQRIDTPNGSYDLYLR